MVKVVVGQILNKLECFDRRCIVHACQDGSVMGSFEQVRTQHIKSYIQTHINGSELSERAGLSDRWGMEGCRGRGQNQLTNLKMQTNFLIFNVFI